MTNEEKDLIVVEAEIVPLGSLEAHGSGGVIEQAGAVAVELANIIKSRELYSTISGRQYVRVEGWTTLGAMLGVLPKEKAVSRLEDGGYIAEVELIRVSDGMVIGGASAICGMDEVDSKGKPTWASRPEYARRSMAITRATGKAYRLGFSWIMTLAGYEATPAEEMADEPRRRKQPRQSTAKLERPLSPDQVYESLQKRAAKGGDAPASQKQVGLLVAKLQECFAPAKDADERRHVMQHWLWGVESLNDLNKGEASAALDWLLDKEADQGTYDLHPAAAQEVAEIYRVAMADLGQEEMKFEDI